jgi:CubicO group peptidase (beta-lactamase class C family)
MRKRHHLQTVLILGITCCVASSSLGLDENTRPAAARAALSDFGRFAEQAIEDWNVPGAAIAVVVDGEVVYAEGFGYRDLEAQLPMTPDTLFAIGSTTKAMTTTVLGMLVDEGKLAWDEPLRTYLPRFRLSDPTISDRITPRDLVTHRSGLPRHDLLWYNNNSGSRSEVVARLAHLELTADLRETFQYNNLMFMTAGYLIEQIDDTTWEEAVRSRLFAPLGMTRSNFSVDDSQKDADFAWPYRLDDDDRIQRIPFRRIDLIGPAGSVNSTVREMARWLKFNLAGGTVGEQQLINPTTLADIHSPHMTMGGTPERPEVSAATYGMGWAIQTYRGHQRVRHGGGIDGFITSVMFFPDDGIGLVAFTNRASGLPAILNQHAVDLILGLDPIDWNGEALEERAKSRQATEEAEEKKETTRRVGTNPSHALGDYTGRYVDAGYGPLEIAIESDGDRALELTFNGITAPLEHWHYDVWSGAETGGDPTFENEKFLFRTNVEGQIAAVEAMLEPRGAPIVFEKQPDPRLSEPEYLRRFVGNYAMPDREFRVDLSGNVLSLTMPGQPTYTLVPDLSGRFVFEQVRVISIGFELDDDGEVSGALLHQPGGVYEAKRKP